MKVFNSFMKILRKHLTAAFIYVGIFLCIGIAMTKTSGDTEKGYSDTKLKISITDLDDTDASRAAVEYISKGNKIVEVGSTKDERLDALYFQKAYIIVTIEKGFSEKLEKGETENLFTEISVPGTYTVELFDSKLNRYINMVNAGIKGGSTAAEASVNASEALSQEADVSMLNQNDKKEKSLIDAMFNFYKYLAYIFIAVILSSLCPVILTMKKKDIHNRINCSSISSTSQLAQIALGAFVFVVGLYIINMIAAAALFKGDMLTKGSLLAMVNAFVFIVVSMMICLLISTLTPSEKSLALISNVVSLGMSFLCGVFVPQRFLGDAALYIGKLLPAYWYVKGTNIALEQDGEMFSSSGFFTCIGVQLAFAAAVFFISLLISKTKRQTSN